MKETQKRRKEVRYPYQVGVRLRKKHFDFVSKYANENGISHASILRYIIEAAMDDYGEKEND